MHNDVVFKTGSTYNCQSSFHSMIYTNISGATSATLTTSQAAATWYHCVVTCTGGVFSSNSSNLQVTMSNFINCYCVPPNDYYSPCSYYITNVSIAGTLLNNPSSCAGNPP